MFTPEDGTGLADANSYIELAWADAYFTDRGNAAWAALSNDQKQQYLIQATDYIDARFGQFVRGCELSDTQALVFPRDLFEGIPTNVKKATAEYAVRASVAPLAPDLESDPSGYQVSRVREKVGPIEEQTDFAMIGSGSNRVYFKSYPAIDILMAPFISSGNKVIRN
jgi:hypothetical protein